MFEYNKRNIGRVIILAVIFIMALFTIRKINYAQSVELTLKPYDESMGSTTFGSKNNPYMLTSAEDFINLQEYSKTDSCEGKYFKVSDEMTKKVFYYTPGEVEDDEGSATGTVEYNINLANIVTDSGVVYFKGFGQNINYPFKGKIDFRGLKIRTDTNLICFMGSGASVTNVNINGTINNTKNISIYNTNTGIGAVANMIYATESGSGTDIEISNVHVSDAVISGGVRSTGGLVGTIYSKADNVNIRIFGNNEVSADVISTSTSDGKCDYSKAMSQTSIQNNFPGYVGGFIGDVTSLNGSDKYINIDISGYNVISGNMSCAGNGGGCVIGHLASKVYVNLDGTVNLSGIIGLVTKHSDTLKGYLVGSEDYSITNKLSSLNVTMPESSLNNVCEIDMNTTSSADKCAGCIYKDINLDSATAKINGEGSMNNPYILSSANDVAVLSAAFCSAGYYGLDCFTFPTTVKTTTSGVNTDRINYLRRAYYSISNDINLNERGVIRLNKSSEVSFYGSIDGILKDDGKYPTLNLNVESRQSQVALIPYAGGSLKNNTVSFKNFNISGSVSGRCHVSGLIWKLVQSESASAAARTTSDYQFENVNIDLNILQYNSSTSYVGGFIGYIDMTQVNKDVPKFTFKKVSYKGIMTVNNSATIANSGGLIGLVADTAAVNGEYSSFVIDTYTYGGNYVSSSGNGNQLSGGVIGSITKGKNESVKVDGNSYNLCYARAKIDINNMNVKDAALSSTNQNSGKTASFVGGSWIQANTNIKNLTIQDSSISAWSAQTGGVICQYSGYLNIDGLTMKNVSINKSKIDTNINSLLIADMTSGICNISGLSIDNSCEISGINNYKYAYEISGDNTSYLNESVYGGIVNINGNSSNGTKYSTYNCYEINAQYLNESGNAVNPEGLSRTHYNMFDNTSDGFIKGTGTKESPLIIDSPEKMVILYAINYETPDNKDLLLKYFGDIDSVVTTNDKTIPEKNASKINAVINANVVFTKDMNMTPEAATGYSYYSMPVHGGNYYGFDVYKYLLRNGIDAPTDEQIKTECSSMINSIDGSYSLTDYNDYKININMNAAKIASLNTSKSGKLSYLDNTDSEYSYSTKNLYSGIFTNVRKANVGVYNLSISGYYYNCTNNNNPRAGALFTDAVWFEKNDSDSIKAGSSVDIRYIDIGDLQVYSNYATIETSSYGVGLLIDTINASTVNFDYINILGEKNVHADALIGLQKNNDTDNSKTVFRHMNLNAALSNEDVSKEIEGKYSKENTYGLRYGIFLYYLKSGNSIYWYETEDKEKPDIMTPGLKNTITQYRTTPNKALIANKKYAYKDNPVDVNPIIGNIIHGKGTEQSPFIIDNEAQLLSLSLCLKTNGDDTKSPDWYVGETNEYAGYDEENSSTWSSPESNNKMKDADAVEYMRTAVYSIDKDINFTEVYSQILPNDSLLDSVNNFCGIGTSNIPFSGKFIGNSHTITIPNFGSNLTHNYGLFQYVSGIYVKDLTIQVKGEKETDSYIHAYDSDSGINTNIGIVAAQTYGADNVIDNVTVKAEVRIKSTSEDPNVTACVGGYFGNVSYGSITLINMTDNSIKDFKVSYEYTNDTNVTTTGLLRSYQNKNNTINKNINGIVGSVTGTYIVYSDDTEQENPTQLDSSVQIIEASHETSITQKLYAGVLRVPELHYTNNYGLRPLFDTDIINENWLQTAGKIVVTSNGKGGYYVDVKNEKQLYILGLAFKSGSMTASTVNIDNSNPYYVNAKTWKSNKSFIGPELTEKDYGSDYPAVLQYFDLSELTNGYKDLISNGYSLLNCVSNNCDDLNKRTTYRLLSGKEYDMSLISEFVGIGDNTSVLSADSVSNKYCIFCANFDGQGSRVKLNIDTTSRVTHGYAALFPQLGGVDPKDINCSYVIQNINLTGIVNSSTSAAGLCAYKYSGRYIFNNINADNLTLTAAGFQSGDAQGNGYAGTLIAFVNDKSTSSGYTNINYGTEDKSIFSNITVKAKNAAGVLAGQARVINANNITIKDSKVTSDTSGAGGMFGIKNNGSASICENIEVSGCQISSAGNNTTGVGGLIGIVNRKDGNISIHDLIVKDNVLSTTNASVIGKVYGIVDGNGYEEGILDFNDLYDKSTPMIGKAGGYANKRVNIYYNDFHDIEYAEQLYGIKREAVNETQSDVLYSDLLEKGAFTKEIDEVDEKGDKIKVPSDLIPNNENTDDYWMLKWSSDAGSIETVINSVLDTLTNGTGKLNNGYNSNIDVKIIPMEVNNGEVSVSSDTPAINIEKQNGTFVCSNNNKYDRYEKTDKTGNHITGTYSLVKIIYSIGAGKYSETITIPVFVSDMINVDIYSSTTIGQEYSTEIMHNITADTTRTITKDSSYTIYTEFMYSYNRYEYKDSLCMNKVFRMNNKSMPVFPVGARLTMVDVTDDIPHTYYFNITSEIIEIPLTSFTDENGNHYKERDITSVTEIQNNPVCTTLLFNGRHYTKTNRGIEKYFIFVDCSNVNNDEGITSIESTIKPSILDNSAINNKEAFYVKERCHTEITTYNPREIGFVDNSTRISDSFGNSESIMVNKNTDLNISSVIFNTASNEYWANAKDNDYNNDGKYLEVAMSLENEAGEKILLPSGTRIKYGDDKNAAFSTIRNTSNIYYFKDGADKLGYALDDITENVEKNINITLNFEYAKMENLPAGNYRICLALVRTLNKDFPMGEDMIQTVYTNFFNVGASVEYGFKLEMEKQGECIYNIADGTQNYDLNFTMLLNSTLKQENVADKDVVVKYRLLKKDKTTGDYKPYDEEYKPGITCQNGENIVNTTIGNEEHSMNITNLPSENDNILKVVFLLKLNNNMEPVNYKIEADLYVNGTKEASDYIIFHISDFS